MHGAPRPLPAGHWGSRARVVGNPGAVVGEPLRIQQPHVRPVTTGIAPPRSAPPCGRTGPATAPTPTVDFHRPVRRLPGYRTRPAAAPAGRICRPERSVRIAHGDHVRSGRSGPTQRPGSGQSVRRSPLPPSPVAAERLPSRQGPVPSASVRAATLGPAAGERPSGGAVEGWAVNLPTSTRDVLLTGPAGPPHHPRRTAAPQPLSNFPN